MKKSFKFASLSLAVVTACSACITLSACGKFTIDVPEIPSGLELKEVEYWENSEVYDDYARAGIRRSSDAVLKFYGSEEISYTSVEGGATVKEESLSESGITMNYKKDGDAHANLTSAYKSEKTSVSGGKKTDYFTKTTHEGCQSGGTFETVRTSREIVAEDKSASPAQLVHYYLSNSQFNALELLDYYTEVTQMNMYSDISRMGEYFQDYTNYYYNYQYNQPEKGIYGYYPGGANRDKGVIMKVNEYDCSVKKDSKHMYLSYIRSYTLKSESEDGSSSWERTIKNKIVVYADIAAGQETSSFKSTAITQENTRKVNYVRCDVAGAVAAIKEGNTFVLSLCGGTAGVKSNVKVSSEAHYKNGTTVAGAGYTFAEDSDNATISASGFEDLEKVDYVQLTAVGSGANQAYTKIVLFLD